MAISHSEAEQEAMAIRSDLNQARAGDGFAQSQAPDARPKLPSRRR